MADTSTYKPKGNILNSIDDSGKNKLKSVAFPVFKEFKITGKIDASALIELSKNNNVNLLQLVYYLFELINKQSDVTTNKIKSELSALADAIVADLSNSNSSFDVVAFKVELEALLKEFLDEAIEKVVNKIDELKSQFSELSSDDKEVEKSANDAATDDITKLLNEIQSYISGQFFALLKNVLLAIEKSLKIQEMVKPTKQKNKEQATLNKTLNKLNKFIDTFFDKLIDYVKPFLDKLLTYAKIAVNKLMTHILAWLLVNVVLLGIIFAIIIKLIAKPLMEILQPILDFISDLIKTILDFLTPIRDNILIPLGLFVLTMLKSIFENVLEPLLKGIGTVAYALGQALGKLVIGIADFFVDVLLPFLRDHLLPVLGDVLDIIHELLTAIKPWIKPLVDVIFTILVDILDTVRQLFEILAPVIVKLAEFLATVLMDILNGIKWAWDKIVAPIFKGIGLFLAIIANIGRYLWAKLRSVLPKWMGGDGGKSLKELENELSGAVEQATDENIKGVNATTDPQEMTIQSEIAILIRQISNGELFVKLANIVVDTMQKSPLISGLITGITNGIKTFVEALDKFVLKIDPIIQSIADAITRISEAVSEAMKPIADAISDSIEEISGAIEDIGDSIESAIERIAKVIANLVEEIAEALKPILTSIGQTIDTLLKNINELVTTISNAINSISNTITTTLTEVKNSIVTAIDKIGIALTEVKNSIVGTIDKIGNAITDIKNSIVGTIDGIKSAVIQAIDKLTEMVRPLALNLTNAIVQIKDSIIKSIEKITTAIVEIPKKIIDGIKAVLNFGKMAKDAAINAGKSVLNGAKNLWNKVSGKKEVVKLTVDQMFLKILDVVDKFLKVALSLANWLTIKENSFEIKPASIGKVVLNTADVGSITSEVSVDLQDDKDKTTLSDVNHNVSELYDFLKPFADATRLNFELILQKLDEKPNLLPIPFTNTDAGNTALMENM